GGDKIRLVQDTFAIDIGTSENLTLTGSAEDTSAGGAIVTDNQHPELPAADAVAGDAKLADDRHDDINGNANNAPVTKSGGEVVAGDFYVTNGTTGMVSDSGKDAKVVGIVDGTSNTIMFAERHALSGAEGDDPCRAAATATRPRSSTSSMVPATPSPSPRTVSWRA